MLEHITEGCQCKGKRCSRCKEVQCIMGFGACKRNKDGLHCHCNKCRAAYARERNKVLRQTHPQVVREQQEKAYRKHISHYRAYQRAYRATHKEEINQKRREQRYHASKQAKEKRKQYRHNNRERFAEVRRIGCITRRARKKNVGGTYTVSEWEALCVQYNHTCLCCGRREPDIKLTVDHVIPLVLGGSNSIDNIQPLCLSCNSSKQARTIDYRISEEERKQWLSQSSEPSNMKAS